VGHTVRNDDADDSVTVTLSATAPTPVSGTVPRPTTVIVVVTPGPIAPVPAYRPSIVAGLAALTTAWVPPGTTTTATARAIATKNARIEFTSSLQGFTSTDDQLTSFDHRGIRPDQLSLARPNVKYQVSLTGCSSIQNP
jgi:hypothetical protein